MLKGAGGSDLGDVTGVTCSGSDAVVESPGNFLGGSYKVTFLNSDGETMKCNGAKGKIADVASVKSVGTYADTARAVQVAVAAGSGGVTGGCHITGNAVDSVWGIGCRSVGTGGNCTTVQDSSHFCGYASVSCGTNETACICVAQ